MDVREEHQEAGQLLAALDDAELGSRLDGIDGRRRLRWRARSPFALEDCACRRKEEKSVV